MVITDRRDFLLWGSALAGGLAVPGQRGWPKDRHPAAAEIVKTGGTRLIPVRGRKYRVWVRRVGESSIMVLLLHGGPGLNHLCFQCFEDFLPQA